MIINVQLINNILVLLILITCVITWIHIKFKIYRISHSHIRNNMDNIEKAIYLNKECQKMDKSVKEIAPAWYDKTSTCVRWAIYVQAINSKDGDDSGTKKD